MEENMKNLAILPATLDRILDIVAPGAISSGSLSLQIALAALLMLSTELWRLSGRLQ